MRGRGTQYYVVDNSPHTKFLSANISAHAHSARLARSLSAVRFCGVMARWKGRPGITKERWTGGGGAVVGGSKRGTSREPVIRQLGAIEWRLVYMFVYFSHISLLAAVGCRGPRRCTGLHRAAKHRSREAMQPGDAIRKSCMQPSCAHPVHIASSR